MKSSRSNCCYKFPNELAAAKKPKPKPRPKPKPKPVRKCEKGKLDLAFLLDSSTSVGPLHWRQILQFVEEVVKPLKIRSDRSRVAVMSFNTSPHPVFGFRKYRTKMSLITKGIRMAPFTEGLTFTGEALRKFRLHPKFYRSMRPSLPRVLVLVTDGNANGDLDEVAEARKLKKLGVKIIAIGVANDINK